MREKMHPIYTAVPARSMWAYVKLTYPKLEEVLCAAIVDPHNARDAAEEYGISGTPHSLEDFWDWRGAIGVDLALQVVSQWTMQQPEALWALNPIANWNRLLAIWCACRVAREGLRYVRESEDRPRISIETTERWLIDDATLDEVRAAAEAAAASSSVNTYGAAYAATSAAQATARAAAVSGLVQNDPFVFAVDSSARAVASAAAYAVDPRKNLGLWSSARDAELLRLREVVAKACLTFPR
jgi:hypothetical protein